MSDYDVVVIGGGAGGISAARTVRNEGATVAMVTDGPIGGDCTFTGCVPSKTLIEAAGRGASFDEAMRTVGKNIDRIAATESAAVLRGEGIDVVEARGRLQGPGEVKAGGRTLAARHVVIATGARPSLPPIHGLEDVGALTSDDLWDLRECPASMVVLGGGPNGCEMAQAFARLGVQVTLLEMAGRVLTGEEPEVSRVIEGALTDAGVEVCTGIAATRVARIESQIEIEGDDLRVRADRLFVSAGRMPNSADLGLEIVGIETDGSGHIVTNARLATSAPNVWAVGDVTTNLPFTHAAAEMGRLAGWNISRRFARYRFEPAWVPWVTFTDPEVGRVGVVEAEAPAGARVVELPMAHNDRAVIADRTEGFVKVIVAPRRVLRNAGGGRVVGATIVAPRAGEMIHEPTLAMRTNMFAGRLAQTTHAYPTWSLGIQKAAAQLFTEIDGCTVRDARREGG